LLFIQNKFFFASLFCFGGYQKQTPVTQTIGTGGKICNKQMKKEVINNVNYKA
jgi:hypothetical protein